DALEHVERRGEEQRAERARLVLPGEDDRGREQETPAIDRGLAGNGGGLCWGFEGRVGHCTSARIFSYTTAKPGSAKMSLTLRGRGIGIMCSAAMRVGCLLSTNARSPSAIASVMSWVTKMMVLRPSSHSVSRSACNCVRVCASTAANGSSIRITGGS